MSTAPICTVLLALSISSVTIAEDLPGSDAIGKLNEFVGDWHFDGVTLDGVPGVQGGEPFRATQTVRWVVPNEELGIEWTLSTTSGQQFSAGRSRIRWDDISGAILNTYAGTDGDQAYRGVATLIGIKGIDLDWRGHESSGTGASLNYETTFAMSDGDHWRVDFIPTCADDSVLEPMRFVWERDNEFKKAIGEFAGIIGEWSRVFQDNRGRTVMGSLEIAWGPGERSILIGHWETLDEKRSFRAAEVIFMDPVSKTVQSRYVGAAGMVGTGVFRNDSTDGTFTSTCAYASTDAMGESISASIEFALEETSLKQTLVTHAANGEQVLDEEARVYRRE